MKKNTVLALLTMALVMTWAQGYSHCEVPCGIYDDQLRIALVKEHITTMEKAMVQISELQSEEEVNYNQLIRWINTKEQHANEIQHIVSQYFMTQRIKPVDPAESEKYEEYITRLSLLHELIIYSMKAKQTTDLANIEKLRLTVAMFEKAYFKEEHHH